MTDGHDPAGSHLPAAPNSSSRRPGGIVDLVPGRSRGNEHVSQFRIEGAQHEPHGLPISPQECRAVINGPAKEMHDRVRHWNQTVPDHLTGNQRDAVDADGP
jgi:hypothetical protein